MQTKATINGLKDGSQFYGLVILLTLSIVLKSLSEGDIPLKLGSQFYGLVILLTLSIVLKSLSESDIPLKVGL